jgi:hypothetical protein
MENNNQQSSVSNVTLESIDDFLPMPGADSVVTSDDDNADDKKPSIFSKGGPVDTSFLDEDQPDDQGDDDPEKKKKPAESSAATADALKDLDEELFGSDEDDDQEPTKKPGRKKIDKSGLVETFSKLIEEGSLFAFEDDKPLEEYSVKDWQELIQANIEEKEKQLREQTPKEFFESLPEELQYAAEYVAKGGKDIKGLFRALAQVEETRSLDPSQPEHQEHIVRQYLQASGFGNGDQDLIEDQIEEWLESGTIGKKASQFKPKLDAMEEEVVKQKLAQQEQFRQQQQQKKEEYMDRIYNTLKPAELNGVKLDPKRQKFLWDELTTVKYDSMTGRPTNLLGKLLEDYQFGKEPRYDLIAETLWLLSDPDDYKENIRKQVASQVTQDTVRKLKTEEARRIATNVGAEEEEQEKPRRIQRKPANIFTGRK